MSRTVQALILCVIMVSALPASARPRLPQRAIVISPGLALAGTTTLDVGSGFSLGGEVSALYWQRLGYVGMVLDTLHDWERKNTRSMAGLMLGFGPIGLDGGYLIEYGEGVNVVNHAMTVRAFLSIGVVSAYIRYGGVFNAPDFVEWGLLLKLPLQLWSVYKIPANTPRKNLADNGITL